MEGLMVGVLRACEHRAPSHQLLLIMHPAFKGITWSHKDTCLLLGNKTGGVLAKVSDPGGSVSAAGNGTCCCTVGWRASAPGSRTASAFPKEGAKFPVLKNAFCGLQSSPVKPQAAEVGFTCVPV